jgi:hypothetical protein
MIGNTHSSDNIALDFLDIVEKIVSQKESVTQSAAQPSGANALNKAASEAAMENNLENYSEPNPEDFVVDMRSDGNEALDSQAGRVLESKIKDLQNEVSDAGGTESRAAVRANAKSKVRPTNGLRNGKALRILNGLGKIAGGLRNKGESFAADVVEATAMGIKNDLVVEANKRAQVVSELQKISFDLKNENKGFASDLVEATIDKILKS